jgi:hypothetical protein
MKTKTLLVVCVLLLLAAAMPTTAQAAMGSAATRIRFQTGATSAAVSGQLGPRLTRDYVLRASAGQIMQVVLWPPTAGARLLIWGADGTPLKRWTNQEQGWQGKLPKTQDYYVQVVALDQAVSYCLRVTVFARIQFARGATSATVSSPVQHCVPQAPEVVGGYALRAFAGQTMRVTLDSPNHNTYLTIIGANGVPLTHDEWSTVWEGILPSTQDYYLLPVSVGADVRFTLTVWISPLGQAAPTRIRFAPGAESATVSGSLAPGSPTRYVLWAARGQRLEIRIWPPPCLPAPVIDVTVTGPGGYTWTRLGLDSAIDPLPVSGDYIITLALQSGSQCTGYVMEVTIPAP